MKFRLALIILMAMVSQWTFAQRKAKPVTTAAPAPITQYDQKLFDAIQWREVGPFRGGRSATVTGVPGKPDLYYFGATGGGVWRTTDAGETWENISDGFFGGSIGSVSVSESDPNVIYVGGGENTVRGNVSYGYGAWKSVDAGKTWTHIGLDNSRHISRIRIHPTDPNIAWAAVMGDLYKSNDDRGVYKTTDGGMTWRKVLFANADAGAVDLILDPNNYRIMYASTWNIRRTPYSLSSGGPGSALWKSTDGGETWTDISANKGLPKGVWGIVGVTVSPANSDRIWAIIENNDGGVFRSDDAGATWTKVNSDRNLRQRAWYYSRIYADPKDPEVVYVMNVSYQKSTDGGRTFRGANAPHGDHHDLWIAPEDPQRMIIADDGGAQISFNGGGSWSSLMNQPTAQFYRVVTDNHFPYRIYAAQQDNSTVRILHRSDGYGISESDWETTAGCECAHLAPYPQDDDIVFGGCYDGLLEMVNHETGYSRAVNVWPDNPMGHGVEDMKYRFQWNYPILFSPHNPNKLYTASNHLHVSYNLGQSWETISPDLTRNDSSRMVSSGGPITQDNTSVEYYCTIFAVAESPREENVIWTGSDDGLIHITRDGGKSWTNVTPKQAPEWIMINSIDPDPHRDGACYVAATSYKSGDYQPYLFKTLDYGQTWETITNGIPGDEFTRVVRVDPEKQGLLYAGTEKGMWISFDDGANWQPFQLNLPIVPVTDLTIKDNNLIAATQGRALWMIDDLTPMQQLSDAVKNAKSYLFKPLAAYRMNGGQARRATLTMGTNHPNGVMIYYYLADKPSPKDSMELTITDQHGKTIQTFSTYAKDREHKLEPKQGSNLFVWDMMEDPAERFDGLIMWWASLSGPKAVPGNYQVTLKSLGTEQTQDFEILKDPRGTGTIADIQKQHDFLAEIRDKMTETHRTIEDIRLVRKQMKGYEEMIKGMDQVDEIIAKMKNIDSAMTQIEEALYQTKNQSPQDPLNFPIRLNNKLAHLTTLTSGNDFPPTVQAIAVKDELIGEIDSYLNQFKQLTVADLKMLNQMIRDRTIDAIMLKKRE
ncbi:MAG: glycosyl hydrolase [Lewinellaceae bacterium]|nr:glycosyl hydrolase [Lewinellaceae bacterium]HPQ98987.1 glycosyl hydrolase [Saprospiraceae bacterium]